MVYGALLAGAVIIVLLAFRRITLKTFIPFGPFLILGALWAMLVLPLGSGGPGSSSVPTGGGTRHLERPAFQTGHSGMDGTPGVQTRAASAVWNAARSSGAALAKPG